MATRDASSARSGRRASGRGASAGGRGGSVGAEGAGQRRRLPSVDSLLRSEPGRRACASLGRDLVKLQVVEVLAEERAAAARGRAPSSDDDLLARAVAAAARISAGPTPVINATGVILHTGLGRAPLADAARRAVDRAARGYVDLEVDRVTGERGRRTWRAEALLRALTGAEDALVVTNGAAALLLALSALARGRQVVISRGELIEIGGGFRIPDVLAATGAKLVEVGTTNRTRVADVREAVGPRTALLLKVHPSNYRVVGFTAAPTVGQLSTVARTAGVPLVHDVGSGLLARYRGAGEDEPTATGSLAEGADLVLCSGDKLLGGAQAGIVLGRADLVARLRRHPVARAVRIDKLQVAALEATLVEYAAGRREDLPTWRMLNEPIAAVRGRARTVADALGDIARVVATNAGVGGGSLPGDEVPSVGVEIEVRDAEAAAADLRLGSPSVFARVRDGRIVLDLRTVSDDEVTPLVRALRRALVPGAPPASPTPPPTTRRTRRTP